MDNDDNDNENKNKKQLFKDSLKMAALCGNGDTYCKMSLYEYNDVLYTKPIDIEKANANQNAKLKTQPKTQPQPKTPFLSF